MFIVDGHLDLAMNAMEWNRDLRLPVMAIREREKDLTDKPDRSNGVVLGGNDSVTTAISKRQTMNIHGL